jgi:hypothetical protein
VFLFCFEQKIFFHLLFDNSNVQNKLIFIITQISHFIPKNDFVLCTLTSLGGRGQWAGQWAGQEDQSGGGAAQGHQQWGQLEESRR